MKVEFLKQFNNDAKKISVHKVRNEVVKAIEDVESAASKKEIKGLKKLSGYKNAFRIRIGDYRIGIFIVTTLFNLPMLSIEKTSTSFFRDSSNKYLICFQNVEFFVSCF